MDGRLRRAGLRVSADAFMAPVWNGWDGLVVAGLMLMGVALYYWYPYPSLGLAIWNTTLVVWRMWRGGVPLLARYQPSQNVIGTRAVTQLPRRRVVLIAPLDSPPVIHRFARWLGDGDQVLLGRVVACALIVLFAVFGMFTTSLDAKRLWWFCQFIPGAYLIATALLDIWQWRAPSSPGALNHAGALAVLLASAEELNAPERIELWMVALGATATGSGLDDLLRRYPFEPNKTLFIVLEGLGSGTLAYLTREGLMRQLAADPLLLRLAAAADAGDPLIDAEPRPRRRSPTIAGELRRKGWRALTIACLDTDGQPPYRGSADDTPAVLDDRVLERAVRLVTSLVRQIDSYEEA